MYALCKTPLKKQRQTTNWEKIVAKHTSDKGTVWNKEVLELNNRKIITSFEKWKNLYRLHSEDKIMAKLANAKMFLIINPK